MTIAAPPTHHDSPHTPTQAVPRSRLRFSDVLRLGASGLRSRPTRAVLSALGIAIGIAAMIAVVGISTSSQARLNDQLASLGTNLLRVEANDGMFGENTNLPESSVGKIRMIEGVQSASGIGTLENINVYRSNLIEEAATGGLTVYAADLDLLDVTATELDTGTWLNDATAEYPTVVLGAESAKILGITTPGSQVWLGGQYFTVVGILQPSALAPELDTSSLIGIPAAKHLVDYDGSPTTVYERTDEASIEQVRQLLPATVKPQAPEEVKVSRPSDALAAKYAADQAFTGLLVGLGSVALLVGGIGVANTMIISVLERRREIGLRRALGATRAHIRGQFVAEALLLSGLGGILGALLGTAVTAVFATINGWPTVIAPGVVAVGIAATLIIGAIAGLYPAIRAARTPPTAALNS